LRFPPVWRAPERPVMRAMGSARRRPGLSSVVRTDDDGAALVVAAFIPGTDGRLD
jgi:hypothetical protein